jgi:hypothetical protein
MRLPYPFRYLVDSTYHTRQVLFYLLLRLIVVRELVFKAILSP